MTITRETLVRTLTEMHPLELYDLVSEILDAKGLDWAWSTGQEEEGTIAFVPLTSPYEEDAGRWSIVIRDVPSGEDPSKVLREMLPFSEEEVSAFLANLPARLYDPTDGKSEFTGITAKRVAERLRYHGFSVELR